MRILSIETSCDETSASVIENGRWILSNVVASQVEFHKKYGGIVPEIASRKHIEVIAAVVKQALDDAKVPLKKIDAVAATYGPGLVGSLIVGLNYAKAIAYALKKPFIAVNHIEGHIYANFLEMRNEKCVTRPAFPFICLVVSGGHTQLILAKDHGNYETLGRTRDDAAGEAFDKVARFLGIGYPGGPIIDEKALHHALKEGWILAAGLDVFKDEPIKPDNPLLELDNVILTPHLGGSSKGCDMQAVKNAIAILRGEKSPHQVV